MTTWVLGLTMMLLATGALQCFIVLMELGKLDLDEGIYSSKYHAQWIPMVYYIEVSYDVLQIFFLHLSPGYSLVGQVKMESLFLLNGMKVKEPSREHTTGLEKNQLVLCSLTQPKTAFWLLVKMVRLSFGTWTMLILLQALMPMEDYRLVIMVN